MSQEQDIQGTRDVQDITFGGSGERRLYDVLTVLTLMLGGFIVPILGWIAGVVLLWASPSWDTGAKWMGTLVWPVVTVVAGLGVVLALVGAAAVPTSTAMIVAGSLIALVGVFVVLPLVFVYLLRARRP